MRMRVIYIAPYPESFRSFCLKCCETNCDILPRTAPERVILKIVWILLGPIFQRDGDPRDRTEHETRF